MVVVGLSAMIVYAMALAMRTGDVHHQETDVKMSLYDSTREGLYKMIQEIRQSSPSRITLGASTITFNIPDPNAPVTAAYAVDWASSDQVAYALGGTGNRQIIRTSGGQTKVIANDVTSLSFTGNGGQPTVVTIAMNVQRALPNGRNIPATPFQMTAKAEVRNTG